MTQLADGKDECMLTQQRAPVPSAAASATDAATPPSGADEIEVVAQPPFRDEMKRSEPSSQPVDEADDKENLPEEAGPVASESLPCKCPHSAPASSTGLSTDTCARLKRELSDRENLRVLSEGEATVPAHIQQLFDAGNRADEPLTSKGTLKRAFSDGEAQASFKHVRERVVIVRPGMIRARREGAFCEQLTAAHAAGDVTFTQEGCGHVADMIDVFTSELTNAHKYPDVAETFARVRAALASSPHTKPFSGKKEETLTMLARSLHPGRHSTPHGGDGHHYDNCTHTSFFRSTDAAPSGPGLHLGLRLLVTLECANVTHVRDPQSRFEYSVQAPCSGAGVGLPVELRGYRMDAPTQYLHAGGSHFLDGTPLPARLQLLMNFSVFDEPAWNATMDAFRLQDMIEAATEGELDLHDPAVAAMVAPLAAAVRARAA